MGLKCSWEPIRPKNFTREKKKIWSGSETSGSGAECTNGRSWGPGTALNGHMDWSDGHAGYTLPVLYRTPKYSTVQHSTTPDWTGLDGTGLTIHEPRRSIGWMDSMAALTSVVHYPPHGTGARLCQSGHRGLHINGLLRLYSSRDACEDRWFLSVWRNRGWTLMRDFILWRGRRVAGWPG